MQNADDPLAPPREPLKQLYAGIPASWYYDPIQYQRELDAVFLNRWIVVARSEELAAPRSYRVVELGTQVEL